MKIDVMVWRKVSERMDEYARSCTGVDAEVARIFAVFANIVRDEVEAANFVGRCRQCGVALVGVKKSARYCSGACRTKACELRKSK